MSLPWYETAVEGDCLCLRWTRGEKRRRVLFALLWLVPAAGAALLLLRGFLPREMTAVGMAAGAGLVVVGLALTCFLASRGPVWRMDRAAGTLAEDGEVREALSDIEKFSIRRIHHPGAQDRERLSYQIVAVQKEDGSSLILGEMDERDALDVSREMARFTGLPLSWG